MTRLATLLLAAGASLTLGCATEAFCFVNCDEDGNGPNGQGDGGPDWDAQTSIDATPGADGNPWIDLDGPTGNSECTPTQEVCNGLDDDCNGIIDDSIDFTSARSCGNCQTDCWLQEHVVKPRCVPPAVTDGTQAGTCQFDSCDTDFYDIDPNVSGCEYYCPWNPDGDHAVDLGGAQGCGKDDDCDGQVDEDVQFCKDVENCGQCGKKCVITNGTPTCVSTAAAGEACTTANTHCQVAQCNAGWVDADRSADNGCEYQCTPTDPPTEICDGKDNDCDKLIDNTDPDLESSVGGSCYGGTAGVCQTAEHQGILKCMGGQKTCCDPDSNQATATNPALPTTGLRNGICDAASGVQVLGPDDVAEACNGLDDDCDGQIDNNPRDVGVACGVSSIGNCVKGLWQCAGGQRTCVGALDPQPELCNGQDENCDGVIDGIVPAGTPQACVSSGDCQAGLVCAASTQQTGKICVTPPTDTGGACDVPLTPPAGYTSACIAGTMSCQGGILRCSGSVTPRPGAVDTCGVDANCDGQIENQPDLQTDVHHCGTCSNDCGSSAFTTVTCVNGQCQVGACTGNRITCPGHQPCDTECIKAAATDNVCNGLDDDCDCEVDEDIQAADTPSPVQACGVSSMADDLGCTAYNAQSNPNGVRVECHDGAWTCTFSAGYCVGAAPDYCLNQTDRCDNKDNNCSGIADEGYVRPIATQGVKGEPCTTDALGACRATGTYTCNANGEGTECSAQSNPASDEICNGIDDDCDGEADEGYGNPGNDPSFIRPEVVALSASGPWIFAYEASRPSATDHDSGSGNGYFDFGPAGAPLDRTRACSVQGRMPWTNVTPAEVEQTCAAAGGRICRLSEWQQGCRVNSGATTNNCLFGYSPAGTDAGVACKQPAKYASAPFCNLGAFGARDSLLPTRSSSLNGCFADWTALGNSLGIYDMTGNAREITRCQPDRAVCPDAAQCVTDCCSGTGTQVASTWLCGALTVAAATSCGGGDAQHPPCPPGYTCNSVSGPDTCSNFRRTSGQPCSANSQCCDDDITCSADGACDTTAQPAVCRSTGTTRCLARGVAGCNATNSPCCGGEVCVTTGGTSVCGGPGTLSSAVYPLMGGAYETVTEDGARCDFSFFKVEPAFRLFDSGFRCCFDENPAPQ